MANYLVTDIELTNVANSIREKGGTTASLSWPTGYITAVEDITTSEDTYAGILVNYPPGSICTATNNTIILEAANTSGQVLFSIPTPNSTPEVWTISCRDNTIDDTISTTINITTYGEVINITLKFADPILNNNNWATISSIAQKGIGDFYWDIGDCKQITLNGRIDSYLTLSNFTTYVFILDFNHPVKKTIADNNIIFGGFKTALSGGVDVCLVDSGYGNTQQGTYFNINHKSSYNYGGWKGCDFRYDVLGAVQTAPSPYNAAKTTSTSGSDATTAAIASPKVNTLMAALPSDFRSVLRLWTRWVNNTGDYGYSVTACIDAGISLLAEFEIFGSRKYAADGEQNYQKQIQYYSTGNSKVKYKHNATSSTAAWRASSPSSKNTNSFCCVSSGGSADQANAQYVTGFSPAFKV